MPQQITLITGATGFIGKHLAERIARDGNFKVRVLCRRESEKKLPPELRKHTEVAYGDLRDQESLIAATRGVSRIFHCAGHVSDWGPAADFHELNVRGTEWLLNAAKDAGVNRFIHFSSIAVFGTPSPPIFGDDSEYGKSEDHYSRTKVEGERTAFSFHSAEFPIVVLRPAVVYGPGGTWMEEPLTMIEKGRMALLGGGEGTCHPTYIENLVDAALFVADHPAAFGKGFIVSDGDSISFKDYFNALSRMAGKGQIQRSIPLPLARAAAAGMEFLARVTHAKSRPLLTQTAIDMVTTRSQMSAHQLLDMGFKPRYSFSSAIEEITRDYANRPKD